MVVWLSSFVSATGRVPLGFWMWDVDVVEVLVGVRSGLSWGWEECVDGWRVGSLQLMMMVL
jgi:hypothetical protein